MSASRPTDPFAALGLLARPGLGDDEVRAAWRRIAAATHPDRADGGDPDRFAAAAAAYTTLRTQFGRSEALADLTGSRGGGSLSVPQTPAGRGDQGRWRWAAASVARLPARVRQGRPLLLALRLAAVAALSATVVAVAGSAPATPALITGALTWLLLTARHDLAPPR
jgi:curved DNA-binding protein CbpA